MSRRGTTLIELLFATVIGLVVLLGAFLFQHQAAITVDSGSRKTEACGATAFAEQRVRRVLRAARQVWIVPLASPVISAQLGARGSGKPALLYADGHEIFFEPAAGALWFDGVLARACRLSEAEFSMENDTLRMILSADQSAPARPGRPPAVRERSTLSSRVHVRPQADARQWQAVPESPHGWCFSGDPIRF